MFEKIKGKLKKHDWVLKLYFKFLESLYKNPIIPNEIPLKIYYRISMGEKLNLKKPINFNEKLQWLKLNHIPKNNIYTICADKYKVRSYVKEKTDKNILNELLLVKNNINEINFKKLPNSFVVKGTKNGHIICHDKNDINLKKEIHRFDKESSKNFGIATGELHYTEIEKKVIVEKYLGGPNGELPLDYKIYCFNGEPTSICVYERNPIDFSTIRYFYDFEWNPQHDYISSQFASTPDRYEKPENLDTMYKIAKELSEPFPFVRVDLYNIKGNIIFGELTFTPTGGFGKAYTNKALYDFGNKIILPT